MKMVNQIYQPELQLNKANTPRPPFWVYTSLFLTALFPQKFMINVMTMILIQFMFPFLDGDVPRRPSYGVYTCISQLIRFARVFSHVCDFNTRNKCLTAKLLKQGYRYHKLRKAFEKFYRRHNELVSKFNVTYSLCQSIWHVTDFNNRNKFFTAKILKQGYQYHKLRKAFSKFCCRHFELIENIMSV